MFRNGHRLPEQLTAALAVVALAAPASAGAYHKQSNQDLRNPDSRSAAIEAQKRSYQDLRNPDARSAAIEAQQVEQVAQAPPPADTRSTTGFDWGDAAIGAGAALGLLMIAMSVMFGVGHRRNRAATT